MVAFSDESDDATGSSNGFCLYPPNRRRITHASYRHIIYINSILSIEPVPHPNAETANTRTFLSLETASSRETTKLYIWKSLVEKKLLLTWHRSRRVQCRLPSSEQIDRFVEFLRRTASF